MNDKKTDFPRLFSPGRIGTLELANRLVMAPMGTNYASETGGVTDQLVEFYERRAQGGTGLLIVENSCVDFPVGKGGTTHLRIDDDRFIPGLSQLTRAVHYQGGKVALQINHSGPSGMPAKTRGLGPVGASAVTYSPNLVLPRPLETAEIEAAIENFAQAALRAQKAGFNAVEVHGGHCYLLAHFLSPFTNRRKDEYGGDLAGRSLILVKTLRRIRELVGSGYPLLLRLSGDEFIPGGRGLTESKILAEMVEAEGVDALHVTAGTSAALHPSGTYVVEPVAYDQGWRVYLAEEIKKSTSLPVITVGVIREPGFADQVIAQGRADFVALGRALVADPDWPLKAAQGREDEIRKCISCNEGCFRRRVFLDLPIRCAVNAEVGLPERFRAAPQTGPAKKILVVGGGPAGMEAARVLKIRGHQVVLWEKDQALGGQLHLAAVPSFKKKIAWLIEYLSRQQELLGVDCRLGFEADPGTIQEFDPDELILATGSVAANVTLPGLAGPSVKSLEELLREDYQGNGRAVTILGGGFKGAELALFLARKGERVTVVEMRSEIAPELEPISRQDLLARLEEHSVRLLTGTKVIGCREGEVELETFDGRKMAIPSDIHVPCLGNTPVDDLGKGLAGSGFPIHRIGDCLRPGMILDAVSRAYQTASRI